MLAKYVPAFNTASKSQPDRLYLDLFAGEPDNVSRATGAILLGSPRTALSSSPTFTRFRFVERDPRKATELEAALRRDFPGRDLRVVPGDCNGVIGLLLRDLSPYRFAPSLAFLDQQGPDLHWSTLYALSEFKDKKVNKVELWLLFPAGMALLRVLPQDGSVRASDIDKLDRMFGCHHWWQAYEARCDDLITGAEFREHLVNLMRWRLENVLGYRWTLPFDVHNERGTSLYHLVLATDEKAGLNIMSDLYAKARHTFPAMAEEERRRIQREREEKRGVLRLFEMEARREPPKTAAKLHYTTPSRPLGLSDDDEC